MLPIAFTFHGALPVDGFLLLTKLRTAHYSLLGNANEYNRTANERGKYETGTKGRDAGCHANKEDAIFHKVARWIAPRKY